MLPEKFLRWQCAEVCEAANTDLTNIPHLFQHRIRLSEPAGESGLDQASTIVASANESCAFSESMRGWAIRVARSSASLATKKPLNRRSV
jgi:hypothetical protein